MTIDSLKDLRALIKLCRITGVESIKVDNIEFHLGKQPSKSIQASDLVTDPMALASVPKPRIYNEVSEDDKIEMPDELTEEQLQFYSARPEAFDGQQQ